MAKPNVYMYGNIHTADGDGVAKWQQLTGSDKIVWCGPGGLAGMLDTAIPNKQRPISGTEIVDEMWIGYAANYLEVALYGHTGDNVTAKGNVDVMMVTWDGPIATNPRITCYDATARTASSPILAGDVTDTGSTSYIKARWSRISNSGWASSTTGGSGADVLADNPARLLPDTGAVGTDLKADTNYLDNDADLAADSNTALGDANGVHCFSNDGFGSPVGGEYGVDLEATIFTDAFNDAVLNYFGRYTLFDILCYTGQNLAPGTYNDKLSFRYTWT